MERVTMRNSFSQLLLGLNYCSSSSHSYLLMPNTVFGGIFQPTKFLAGIPIRVEGISSLLKPPLNDLRWLWQFL